MLPVTVSNEDIGDLGANIFIRVMGVEAGDQQDED